MLCVVIRCVFKAIILNWTTATTASIVLKRLSGYLVRMTVHDWKNHTHTLVTQDLCGSSKLNNDNVNNVNNVNNNKFYVFEIITEKILFLSTIIPLNSSMVFIKSYFISFILLSLAIAVIVMSLKWTCAMHLNSTRTCRHILYMSLLLLLLLLQMLDKANKKRQRNSQNAFKMFCVCARMAVSRYCWSI